jgi:hypothetical protein
LFDVSTRHNGRGIVSDSASSSSLASSLEERLTRMERTLATLSDEMVAIRAELGRSVETRPAPLQTLPPVAAPTVAATPHPAIPAEKRQVRRRREDVRAAKTLDVERILGRYGMLGIAVLTAVAAVGTFLSWAISHGYIQLGPTARVAIGVGVATGLGIWGFRLRRRERSFGSSILGLALVIIQVCAYAAGPGLQLVPALVAFGGAALVSWALAIFAHAEEDEPLWCVSFGGAALAPFVTNDGSGRLDLLLIYGLLVLLPACFAISHRDWGIGWRVFYGVAALFTFAAADLMRTATGAASFVAVLAFPLIVAAAGVIPFAPERRKRGALRWLAGLAVVVSLGSRPVTIDDQWITMFAFMGATLLWLFIIDRHALVPQSSILDRALNGAAVLDWVDAAGIPLVLALQASYAFGDSTERWPVLVVAVALFTIFAWRRVVGPLRDAAALMVVVGAAGIVLLLPLEDPLGRIAAFAGLGLAVLAMHRLRPSVSWLVTGLLCLLVAAGLSEASLARRPSYEFTPFATEASLTALIVAASFVAVLRFWLSLRVATRVAMGDQPEWTYADSMRVFLRLIAAAPWVWVFVWVLAELARAYSPSTSTLLLVIYFAATAVVCVWVGHSRHSARVRHVGLGLALIAAGTAFYGAHTYFEVAAQIAAYLVTSAFLLGIAYWYRRPGAGASDVITRASDAG